MSVVNAIVEIFQTSGFVSLSWQNWVMIAVSFILLYFLAKLGHDCCVFHFAVFCNCQEI